MEKVYIVLIVYCNSLEFMSVIEDKDIAETTFVEKFNQWTKSDNEFETYDECISYWEERLELDDENEFDDLLMTLETAPINKKDA